MSKTTSMQKHVADLAVMNVKLHNLHWNVSGIQFKSIHEFTEALYEDIFVKYDDVAEMLKIQGEKAPARMSEYLSLTGITELDSNTVTPTEVLNILQADLEYLVEAAASIRREADKDDDFSTVALFEDHIAYYQKQLWFIRSMLG